MKQCSKCQTEKPDESFQKVSPNTEKRRTICKACRALYAKQHYEAHKADYIYRAQRFSRLQTTKNKSFIVDFLKGKQCVDCGENNPLTFQFDHVTGTKTHNISDMVRSGYSLQRLQEEIKKCVIRCANCHQVKTMISKGWFKSLDTNTK